MVQIPVRNDGIIYSYGLQFNKTAGKTFDIDPGAARSHDNTNDIVVDSKISVDLSKSGAGGVDTGSVAANTSYTIYLIDDSTNHRSPSAVVSTSVSEPQLPVGYDVFSRMGFLATSGGSDILQQWNVGIGENRIVYYDVSHKVLTNGSSTSYADVDLSPYVPKIECMIQVGVQMTGAGVGSTVDFTPGTSSSSGFSVRWGPGTTNTAWNSLWVPVFVESDNPTLQYKLSSGSDLVSLYVQGYRTNLSFES